MMQSAQDDIFDNLSTFAEMVYINLVLVGTKRGLNDNEAYILERAAQVADQLHQQRA